jgi:hypothetical protein
MLGVQLRSKKEALMLRFRGLSAKTRPVSHSEEALTHFPQLVVHKGQNPIAGCQKLVGYQPPFFENQM